MSPLSYIRWQNFIYNICICSEQRLFGIVPNWAKPVEISPQVKLICNRIGSFVDFLNSYNRFHNRDSLQTKGESTKSFGNSVIIMG